jgi:uncharacterized damage-inducible protein DinB
MAVIESIRGEFVRYKALAEAAIAQVEEEELSRVPAEEGNSIATICWHVSGNLQSRFTDFLTTDGEKPWRRRDEEFDNRAVTREELVAKWNHGWTILDGALAELTDQNLSDTVVIRGVEFKVHEALHRLLAHASYHVGQIVFLAKMFRGDEWNTLSIARGASDVYNANPTRERPR